MARIRSRSKNSGRLVSRHHARHMPAWGWLATWLVGMSALVLLASQVLVPRAQAREQATDQRLLEGLHGTIAGLVTRPVTLTVVDRRVSLAGDVSSASERDAIVAAARDHEGVAGVDGDALIVVGGGPDGPGDPGGPDDVPAPPDEPPATAPSTSAPRPAPARPPSPDSPPPAPEPDAIDGFGDESFALADPAPEGPPEAPEPDEGGGPDADVPAPLAPAAPDAPTPDAPPGPDGPAPEAPGPGASVPDAPTPLAARSDRPASLSMRVADASLSFVGSLATADESRLARFVGPATEAFDPNYVENTVQTADDVAPAVWLEPLEALLIPLAGLGSPVVDIDADRLSLGGTAPAEAARTAVLEAAARLFPDHALEDRIALGAAIPPASRSGTAPTAPVAPDSPAAPTTSMTPAPDGAPAGDPTERRAALRAAFDALPERRILFESGTAAFADDSGSRIDTLAELLRAHPGVRVEIEGHTDASGAARDNLALSQRRANAVRDALVAAGVARDRLVAYGYGEGVPLVDNATPEGRARNRRIEFRF